MSGEGDFVECAVCTRNILRGERVTEYVTPEREIVAVCALCKTRAEQMGWTQASLAAMPGATEPERRRGLGLRERFTGRIARRERGMTADELAREIGIPDRFDPASDRPEADEEPLGEEPFAAADLAEPFDDDDAPPDPVDRPEPRDATAADERGDDDPADHDLADPEAFWAERNAPREVPSLDEPGRAPARSAPPRRRSQRGARPRATMPEAPAEPEAAEEPVASTEPSVPQRKRPRTPARLMRTAAENFNASEESRKVSGLMRSLGEPSVSLRPPAREHLPALLTVAWELSWYQWEVGVEPDDASVREIAKGTEIEELDEPARQWNALTDEDGMIRLRRASSAEDA